MLQFVREAKLFNCGFFAYSREPDTGAYRLQPQVHHKTKQRRVKALYEAQAEIAKGILDGFVGKKIEVVCDGIDYDKGCFVGRAYFNAPDIDGKVYFNATEAMQGERYEVVVSKVEEYDLYAATEEYVS